MEGLDIGAVRAAAARIAPHVTRTPLVRHDMGEGASLFVKPESLQAIGAFKIRGAFNFLLQLPPRVKGVVAHSSGNHAQAVARAAKTLGFRAVIVMPGDAPALKRARTEADGAEIVTVSNDSDERARRADEIAKEREYVLVPPYDHPFIAAGQGTAALEIVDDAKARGLSMTRFYCPVSGGGLMAGCATVFAALSPATEIVGVEPEGADDTKQSLRAGERLKVAPPTTIADGLRVRTPGILTFPVLRQHVSRIETVTDEELLRAMRFAMTELRLVLEPSGAASLAVALRERRGDSVALLSGGNVDPEILAAALRFGL